MKLVRTNISNLGTKGNTSILDDVKDTIDMTGEDIYIGIDMHKKQWTIAVKHRQRVLRNLTIDPRAKVLHTFLANNYPGANYYSAYEAGCFGFTHHQKLVELGIANIVINPADIPTTNKERTNKNDSVDAKKIVSCLEAGILSGIYIPEDEVLAIRRILRQRYSFVKDKTRTKNRIKSILSSYGIVMVFDDGQDEKSWSKRFIKKLEDLSFPDRHGKNILARELTRLQQLTDDIKEIEKELKAELSKDEHKDIIKAMKKLPGIGDNASMVLRLEIMNIKRFPRRDQLAAFAGLIPMAQQSGENETVTGISSRKNKFLRRALIESAWIASKHGKYLVKYTELCKRMKKNKAIVRIAKMLLFDARREWIIAETRK